MESIDKVKANDYRFSDNELSDLLEQATIADDEYGGLVHSQSEIMRSFQYKKKREDKKMDERNRKLLSRLQNQNSNYNVDDW